MLLVDAAGMEVSPGSQAARDVAVKLGKPHIVLDLDTTGALALARDFLGEGGMSVCIAGPRESEAPGIYAKASAFLGALL
jgi:hypothetical protein